MGNTFALPPGETLLGRHADCVFRFSDPAVSRRHARLIRRQDEVFVEDLGSANGTLLNGRTVAKPIRLHHGDVITIGGRDIKISFSDPFGEEQTIRVAILAKAADAHLRLPRVGARTTEMPAVLPPRLTADDRCPRCSAVVRDADRRCGNCGYQWGTEPLPGGSLNRRRNERYPTEIRVDYASDQHQFEGATLDISETGMFLLSRQLDAVGTHCRLTVFVGNEGLFVGGVVRRVSDPETHPELVGLGIELTEVGPHEHAVLLAFLAELAKSD
jgi:hypothetical protein